MVFESVKEILVEQMGVNSDDVTLDTRLNEDLLADSIDKAEIVTQLEDKFHIIIDYKRALSVKTVGDIVKEIEGAIK